MKNYLLILVIIFVSGCGGAATYYKDLKTGDLEGKLIVQWIDRDRFIFLPDEENPLTFTRSDGSSITPQQMYTDGGSIPRPLWVLRNYSPWGYAPAFIIHDWLFEMKHCQISGYEQYDYKIAADVMSEIIKTLMEDPQYGGKNELVLYSMYKAVNSEIAKGFWDEEGCNQPQDDEGFEALSADIRPIAEYIIEYP